MMPLLWVSRPDNTKTGRIPTAYVGRSKAEARASCKGCPLLPGPQHKEGSPICYSHSGTVAHMGLPSILRTIEREGNAERYLAENAIAKRTRNARAIRFGALGDPSTASRSAIRRAAALARSAGLSVLGYTHFWRRAKNAWLRGFFMASCDTLADADRAIAEGWKPAAVVPRFGASHPVTPGGARLLKCPAQSSHGRTQCNDCRLCDPTAAFWTKQSRYSGIAFEDHGPDSASRKANRAARRA